MSQGWIKLHRQLQHNDLWTAEKFTRGQAWIDMLLLANHKPGYVRVRGIRIDLERGQLGWSVVKLSGRWGWSRDKIKRFFNELERDGQITQQTSQQNTVVTICNYEKYQDGEAADESAECTADLSADRQQTLQQTGSKQVTNKNEKNEKNEKKERGHAKKSAAPPSHPPFTSSEKWTAYVKVRRQKKHPVTPESLQLCADKLQQVIDAGIPANPLMDLMIENGWRTAKLDWDSVSELRPKAQSPPSVTIDNKPANFDQEAYQAANDKRLAAMLEQVNNQ